MLQFPPFSGAQLCVSTRQHYGKTSPDYIPEAGLSCVTVNELNTGHAADSYACLNGASALVTAFDVGELSALNAVAPAFNGYVPMTQTVSTSSTISQANDMCLHHARRNSDFRVFPACRATSLAVLAVLLKDPGQTVDQIDRAKRGRYIQDRTGYIELLIGAVERIPKRVSIHSGNPFFLSKDSEAYGFLTPYGERIVDSYRISRPDTLGFHDKNLRVY